MAGVHDVFPAGSIITNGLGHNYDQGFLIGWQTHLYFVDVSVAPIIIEGLTGGGTPLAPGEIATLYKPIEWLTPRDQRNLLNPGKHVTLKIKLGKIEIEKEYVVHEKTSAMIVQLINFINTTKSRIKVVVDSIKHIAIRAMVRIRNLRRSLGRKQ